MMKKSSQAYIYAALSVFLWGTIPTAFKLALSELSIVTMLGITTFVSMAVLFVIMVLTGKLYLLKETTLKDLAWSALNLFNLHAISTTCFWRVGVTFEAIKAHRR